MNVIEHYNLKQWLPGRGDDFLLVSGEGLAMSKSFTQEMVFKDLSVGGWVRAPIRTRPPERTPLLQESVGMGCTVLNSLRPVQIDFESIPFSERSPDR